MTPAASMLETMQALAAQAAVFLSLLLAAAALHKACAWRRSLTAAQRFAGLPRMWAAPGLCAVVGAELAAAVLLAVPRLRLAGGIAAAAVWSLYLALVLRAIAQGKRDVDCGCSFGAGERPLGVAHVTRNVVLIGLAAGTALAATGAGAAGLSIAELTAGVALLALYAALDQVTSLQPLRGGEVR